MQNTKASEIPAERGSQLQFVIVNMATGQLLKDFDPSQKIAGFSANQAAVYREGFLVDEHIEALKNLGFNVEYIFDHITVH